MSEKKPHLKVNYCLACENVRRELSYQLIFVGVYTKNIRVHEFPQDFNIQCWLDVTAEGTGRVPTSFRFVRQPGNKGVMLAEGAIEVDDPDLFTDFTLEPYKVRIEEPGVLRLQMKQYDEPWKTIHEMRFLEMSETDD